MTPQEAAARLWRTAESGGVLRPYLYAILDAAADERIYQKLLESQDETDIACLYQGQAAEALADLAPYLVRVTEAFFSWWWDQDASGQWGIFLWSPVAFETLCTHVRALKTIQVEGGEELIFRFYDPRALSLFTSALGQQRLLEGLVCVESVAYRQGAELVIFHAEQAVSPSSHLGLSLSAEEMEHLDYVRWTAWVEAQSKGLAALFPHLVPLYGPEGFEDVVDNLLRRAAGCGFTTFEDGKAYCHGSLALGVGFESRDDLPWMREVMQAKDDTRLDLLRNGLAAHLSSSPSETEAPPNHVWNHTAAVKARAALAGLYPIPPLPGDDAFPAFRTAWQEAYENAGGTLP